jgi:hypothetical protein
MRQDDPAVWRENSELRGEPASSPDLSTLAARLAAQDGSVPAGRAARLGVALAGLAQELAAARRDIAVLKRENAALRGRSSSGPPAAIADRRDPQ